MFDTDNLCPLALEVLAGEKHANKILADLLEEQGQRGLAQWARSRKNNLRKRLDITLAVIPCTVALRLACDFADHVIEPHDTPRPSRSVSLSIDGLRNWAMGPINQEDEIVAKQWCEELFVNPIQIPVRNECLKALSHAGVHVIEATTSLSEDRESKRRFHAFEAVTHIRNVAKFARCTQVTPYPELHYGETSVDYSSQSPEELRWQILRTQEVLEKIVTPGR